MLSCRAASHRDTFDGRKVAPASLSYAEYETGEIGTDYQYAGAASSQ